MVSPAIIATRARVTESVDVAGLKPATFGCTGSSPVPRTTVGAEIQSAGEAFWLGAHADDSLRSPAEHGAGSRATVAGENLHLRLSDRVGQRQPLGPRERVDPAPRGALQPGC